MGLKPRNIDLPGDDGGKETSLQSDGMTMTHDQLAMSIGPAYQKILNAGFVLVPRCWRDDVFKVLDERAKEKRKSNSGM